MQLRISLKNQLLALKFHLETTVLMIIGLYFIGIGKISLIAIGSYWGLFTFFTLILHIKYYLINRGQEIIITENGFIVKNVYSNDSLVYDKQDIKNIELCRSASKDKGGMPMSPMESYQHIKIIFKSKDVVIITNLMEPNLDYIIAQFPEASFVRRKGIFCIYDTYPL